MQKNNEVLIKTLYAIKDEIKKIESQNKLLEETLTEKTESFEKLQKDNHHLKYLILIANQRF